MIGQKPEHPVLPVAVRGVMLRDPKTVKLSQAADPSDAGPNHAPNPSKSARFRRAPPPRPRRFILIAEPPQAEPGADPPLLTVALCGGTADWHVNHEVLVYRDDASPAEIDALRRYVEERTQKTMMPAGNGAVVERLAWCDDPRIKSGEAVRVSLIPLAEFQNLFYNRAHKLRHLVVSYNLPRALAHIARHWDAVERGERFVKGWALEMLASRPDQSLPRASIAPREGGGEAKARRGERNRKHRSPSVFIKTLPAGALRIELNSCGKSNPEDDRSYHRGQFLDLSRLAYALSTQERSLEDALAAFACPVLPSGAEDIERHRQRAHATLTLTKELTGIFDRLPTSRTRQGGSQSETRLQSPAGLSRAMARHVGLATPAVPRDKLGLSAAAFFGGRIESRWRGEAPIATVDFSKTYPTIAALAGLQGYLAADQIAFEDATEEARGLAATLSPGALFDPARWPGLAVLCLVRPQGEPLPTCAMFNVERGGFSFALPYRWAAGPVPLFLPDVIAAKLLCGSAPEIVQAWRMVPAGERRRLQRLRLPSGFLFDPSKHDIFRTLVEEGERLRRGLGRWREIPAPVREKCLYPAWKASNNGLSFGSLAQTNSADKAGDAREEVTLVHDEGELRVETPHPEDPGPLFCMPLASLVTSCGRLLLAMVDALVAARGGIVAAGHTDSAHIVATEAGGVIDGETQSGGGNINRHTPLSALSYGEVEEIAAAFRPLNPFDPALMPGSPLKIESTARMLILTPSFYCKQALDHDPTPAQGGVALNHDPAPAQVGVGPHDEIVDATGSWIGEYLPPGRSMTAETWAREAWRYALALWRRKPPPEEPAPGPNRGSEKWRGRPAVRVMSLSRPSFADKVQSVVRYPFDNFLVAEIVGDGVTALVVAPYDAAPERWAALPWQFYETGEQMVFGEKDANGQVWRLRTIEDVLRGLVRVHPRAALDAFGRPCDGQTRGRLKRLSMRDGRKFATGKDRIGWKASEPGLGFDEQPAEAWAADGRGGGPDEACDWQVIRAAVAVIGTTRIARASGIDERSVRRWIDGSRSPASPYKVAKAAAKCVLDIDPTLSLILGFDAAVVASDVAICLALPAATATMQSFLAAALGFFATAAGGMRALARTTGIAESTLRQWHDPERDADKSLARTVSLAKGLGKTARARIKSTRLKSTFWSRVAGDMQAILAALALAAGEPPSAAVPPADLLTTAETWLASRTQPPPHLEEAAE